ncbi:MAG TPA: peptidylprolyl isomerase [Xanthomonadales bacterium]|nr:peptidylprolyl isomerase [Xanthomonadales bacterium]
MHVADRCVVYFDYRLSNAEGMLIDSSEGHGALAYLHGAGGIVPGLEKAMTGRQAGDSFQVVVAPEEGYGVHDERLVQVVPIEAFRGIDAIEPGMHFTTQGGQGPVDVVVTAVDADQVTIDGNHFLAGMALHFDIKIVDVRAATDEEMEHGHVHGEGGHHH